MNKIRKFNENYRVPNKREGFEKYPERYKNRHLYGRITIGSI